MAPTFNRRLVNTSEIARQLGISQNYVSLILRGKRKAPKYRKLINELLTRELAKDKAA